MRSSLTISAVIPAHNEADGIGDVIRNIPEYVDEIVVVDNNSTDDTANVARESGAVVVSEPMQGYGNALKAGMRAATGDLVVTLDGDGTYPVAEIGRLVDVVEANKLDFLSGARFPLQDKTAMSSRNQFGNEMLNVWFGILYGKFLKDSQSGMWVIRRSKLALFDLRGTSWEFSSEIKIEGIVNPNVKFAEEHIHYAPRVGKSHFHAWHAAIMVGLRDIWFLIARRFRRRPKPYDQPIFLPEIPSPSNAAAQETGTG